MFTTPCLLCQTELIELIEADDQISVGMDGYNGYGLYQLVWGLDGYLGYGNLESSAPKDKFLPLMRVD